MRKSLDNTNCLFFLNRKKLFLVAKHCKYSLSESSEGFFALSESQQTPASLAHGGGKAIASKAI